MGYYRRRRVVYRGSRDKYSMEHASFAVDMVGGAQVNREVVPAIASQGMRKVKHLNISVASVNGDTVGSVYWALVYVPQQTAVGVMQTSSTTAVSLYEPNQFVMSCGVFDFSAGPVRISSPISRNLNSGDSIYLCLASTTSTTFSLNGVVNYAVTFN